MRHLQSSWVEDFAGEAEEDGYEDQYQLESFDITAADYIKPQAVSNFRNSWEELGEESELVDDYGLGQRDSLQVLMTHQSFFPWPKGQGLVGVLVWQQDVG